MPAESISIEFVADTSGAESLLWLAIDAELSKGTPLGLITAFCHVERWIHVNQTNITREDIARVLDHFEELISE